jgi:hypothetical protein
MAIRISVAVVPLAVAVGCVIGFFYVSSLKDHSFTTVVSEEPVTLGVQGNAAFIDSFGLLQSVMSPQLQWCTSNPFLARYKQIDVLQLELRWFEWSQNSLPRTYEILKSHALHKGRNATKISHLAYPTALPLPCPYRGNLKRYGGIHDGNKILCGVESLKPSSRCIVYSLGSLNNFDFELDLLKHTACEIHTYDCTSRPPEKQNKRLHFHQICMGEPSPLQSFIFPNNGSQQNAQISNISLVKSFHRILTDNHHTHLHILKMDIEGGEYSVFADLLRHPASKNLPYQISFESHWWNRDIYHATMHQQMFAQLWRSGYRFLQHEDNPGEETCVEWTVMRVFC